MRIVASSVAVSAALILGACSSAPPRPPPPAPAAAAVSSAQLAQAALAPASASLVSGKLSLTPSAAGVRIAGQIGGLPRGSRFGFHIHEQGDCSAVDASSAGPHFNPLAAPHGNAKIGAHHAGDLDNLVSGLDGVAQIDQIVSGVTLGGGAANDIAGRALVVHADPDDYRSQPAGNSGARVACGVIRIVR